MTLKQIGEQFQCLVNNRALSCSSMKNMFLINLLCHSYKIFFINAYMHFHLHSAETDSYCNFHHIEKHLAEIR